MKIYLPKTPASAPEFFDDFLIRHIKNVFESGELKEMSTVAKIATVQKEGKREIIRDIEYFNLDMILSVGYRVNSKQATQFRIWATN